jgi:hypothetical protein
MVNMDLSCLSISAQSLTQVNLAAFPSPELTVHHRGLRLRGFIENETPPLFKSKARIQTQPLGILVNGQRLSSSFASACFTTHEHVSEWNQESVLGPDSSSITIAAMPLVR